MSSSIFFPIAAIPFSILLVVLFFVKGHIKNEETRIYSYLLVSNFCGLIIEILCTYASRIFVVNPFISCVIYKMYLIYLVFWIGYLLSYIHTLSFGEVKNKSKILLKILLLLEVVIICFLPIDVIISDDFATRYTTGLAVYFTYLISFIDILIIVIMVLIKKGKIGFKKLVPIYIFIIFGIVVSFIQSRIPSLLLMTYMETFICCLMYFTIENPDVKIAERLAEAKKEADRANKAKSEFLSSMSHEIRTPLNAIIGFSEFIVETDDIDEAHSQAKDVVNASQILLETVNGILDISKVEAGKIEIVEDNYNLKDLLDNTVKMAKARMGEKKLDFRVHFAEDLPDTLYGDKGNLQKVLINLLTNAIKYTNEGYIEYSVQCANSTDNCRLIITVKDSGIGIKKENIEKLFTRFQRFDEKNNGTIEGTGLGLAITKQLVEMMGGNIVVSSIYGEGSNFTVALDQKISLTHVQPTREIVEEGTKFDFSDKSILVVDDNNLNLKLAERIFLKYNAKVQTVTSGFACLDLINQGKKYDIILLDDVMPKMLGSETLTRLKRIQGFDTPVIALTANALSGMKEKYILLGFDDYLAKPIEKDQLEIVLKKYLVDGEKAKKLNAVQLTSSKPLELIDENVKEAILSSPSSKDTPTVIVNSEKEENTNNEIEIKQSGASEEVMQEVVKSSPVNASSIPMALPDSENYTDYSDRKILIVDDNKLNIKVAGKFLGRYRFKMDEAYSGQECIDKVKNGEKYDIIFMDIMMPNMTGVETFHALEAIEGFDTPIVVGLTADAVEGAQERYLGEGFAEYISKPIVRERLDKVIHDILDSKK